MQKLWLDPEGNLIPVANDLSHEEHAQAMGYELESLLAQGWVRIQNVPPPYILIDFHLPFTARQTKAVNVLFGNRFEQVVVEFQGEAMSFTDGDAALQFALSKGKL